MNFSHQEQVVLARALLKRGHVVDGDLSRIFKRSARNVGA